MFSLGKATIILLVTKTKYLWSVNNTKIRGVTLQVLKHFAVKRKKIPQTNCDLIFFFSSNFICEMIISKSMEEKTNYFQRLVSPNKGICSMLVTFTWKKNGTLKVDAFIVDGHTSQRKIYNCPAANMVCLLQLLISWYLSSLFPPSPCLRNL